jgi:hypothetical protein
MLITLKEIKEQAAGTRESGYLEVTRASTETLSTCP